MGLKQQICITALEAGRQKRRSGQGPAAPTPAGTPPLPLPGLCRQPLAPLGLQVPNSGLPLWWLVLCGHCVGISPFEHSARVLYKEPFLSNVTSS